MNLSFIYFRCILLSTDKNEAIVKYTLLEDNKNILSLEFRLTIPSEKDFINVIEKKTKDTVVDRSDFYNSFNNWFKKNTRNKKI